MRPMVPLDLARLTGYACDQAKRLGASQCAASVFRRRGQKVVCRDGKWEEISGATRVKLTVRLFVDGRYAVHSTAHEWRGLIDWEATGAAA